MANFLLLLCVATWSLNLSAALTVPLHGPSPLGSPSGRSVKATTAMPMKMMIDMRGFPDLEGNCFRGEGFYRNKTDCTQFYRCVDYFKKQRYTFYRFMCGPMTVFDESRSLCTGPDMAVPKCNETTPTPTAPPTVSTGRPVTITETKTPELSTTTTPIPCEGPGRCTQRPFTEPDTPATDPNTPVTPESTSPGTVTPTPSTEVSSVEPDTTTTESTVTASELTTSSTDQTATLTSSTPSAVTEGPVVTQSEGTSTSTTESTSTEPVVSTEGTTTTTEGTVTDIVTSTGASPSVSATPSTVEVTPDSTTTGSTSTEPVNLTEITSTTTEGTTVTTEGSTTTTAETTTQSPSVNDGKLIIATDQGDNETTPQVAVISTDNQYGILIQKDTVFSIDGTSLTIPSSSVLVFETQQDGGSVTNVINGLTSSSTTANLPQGTKVYIYKLNSKGEIISKVQVLVTQSTSTVTLPAKIPAGYLQITSQNKLYSIGHWVYSYSYVIYQSQISYYQVISSVKTTTVTVQTESKGVSGNGQYISGIMTVGGTSTSQTEQSYSELTVTGAQQLAIIPPGGNGTITVTEESGESSSFTIQPGMMMTVSVPAGLGGSITNLQQQFFTSSTSQLKFTAGCVITTSRITTSGKLETVSTYTVKSASTVQTAVQSSVGVLNLSQQQEITTIGQASFTVQQLQNPSETVYLGVVNLNGQVFTSTAAPPVTSPPTVPSTESTTTPTTTTTTPSTRPGGVEIIDIPCPISDPNDFSKFSLHEYPYDCSKFTQCLRQQGQDVQFFVFPCAEGLFFNSQTFKCDRKESVQCDVSSLNSTTGGGVFGIQCTGDMYRYPINCQAFYQCIADDSNPDSVTMFLYSCADGLVFDEGRRSCLTPSETSSCDDQLFRDYEFNEDVPIDTSFIYRLSQELHTKTEIVKRIESRSSLYPHHAGRAAAGKRVMIRMSGTGINGRLHVANYP